jgi:flagellar hook-basal body complex protein FliE
VVDLVASIQALSAHSTPAPGLKEVTANFEAALSSAVQQVDTLHVEADNALQMLASGEHVDLHGTMIALEKADIALRTMVTVRDKMVGAYEQIMNMAI